MAIPESVLTLSSVPEIDYVDRFTLATDVHASPEQWARAMFGDVPGPGELFIWRVLLGLRLSRRPGPATVAGWRIGGHGEDWIRLEAASWFLSANLLVQTGDAQVSLVTLLHYGRRPAGAVWPPLSAVHRRLVPRVLRDAEARIRRGGVR
ncbi:hypothetical protein [Actinoplanes auranticolor]|uniref:Uncharacterized protein n=1 Tax=Actinoplanes auranticolor TaxID=47988 RepID=A0A919SAE6_9ACTN|nr:hypothetical protein [Actinoplanes auranticolor]GIM67299.1 hypothetical protein Aau02nite_26790 [Actinoplanes auranticolor]